MSGRELAGARGRSAAPDSKVLFMSGYTDDAIVQHGVLDAGHRLPPEAVHAATPRRKVREVLDTGESTARREPETAR